MRLHRKVLLLTVLLVLSGLSGLSWVVNPAHAGTSITFRSVVKNFCNPCTSLVSPSLTIAVSGDALIVAIYGEGAFNNFALSDTQGNSYTERVSSIAGSGTAASTYIFTTLANGAGGDVLTVTTGGASRIFGYSFMDYSNVLGFGVTATDQQDSAGASAVSTVTLTNTQGSGSAIVENHFTTGFGGGGTSAVLTIIRARQSGTVVEQTHARSTPRLFAKAQTSQPPRRPSPSQQPSHGQAASLHIPYHTAH